MNVYIYTYIYIDYNVELWDMGHVGNISIRPLGCGYVYPEPNFPQVKEKPGKEDRKASKAGVAL